MLSTTVGAYVLAVVLGLLWGSFANVCIYRWPAGGSVVKPDSHCFACKTAIRWFDNVPILSYLWLPYMILPIYAGLDRIPESLLEASADLGARNGTTFRRVVVPMVFPALVAGSIFTFSLTLGDYITPDLVSDAKFIGNVIYDNSSLGNLPLAAAYSLVPIVIMIGYLLVARRLGAFESL